jgi:hypothetical protein
MSKENAEAVILLTKPCLLCNKTSEIEVTAVEAAALKSGAFAQDALAGRDAAFRELVISGTHSACWFNMFGYEDEV